MIKYIQFLVLFLFVKINYSNAQTIVYANDIHNLYSIDIENCNTKLIGNLDSVFLDIAYNPKDQYIYGLTRSKFIYKIDPQNAKILSKLPITFGGNALIIDNNGLLYGFDNKLFTYDFNNNILNNLTDVSDYRPSGDLGFLNGLTILATENKGLVSFDKNKNYTLLNNSESIWNSTYGITTINDSCKSNAYAFANSNIYKINHQTYNLTLQCQNLGNFYGATSTSESKVNLNASLDKNISICFGDSILLEPKVENAKYLWNDGSVLPYLNANQSGQYWVTVEKNGCISTDSTSVNQVAKPPILFINDTIFCDRYVYYNVNYPSVTSYLWSNGSSSDKIVINESGNWWVKRSIGECSSTSYFKVQNYYIPNFSLGKDTLICENEEIILTPPIYDTLNYLWNDGSKNVQYKVKKSGKYKVTVSNQYCSKSDSININYSPLPKFNLGRDTILCKLFPIKIGVRNNILEKYIWNTGESFSEITTVSNGEFVLKVKSKDNCYFSDTILINRMDCESALEMPNIFTPNSDSLNDYFKPIIIKNINELTIQIFNRWGEVVYESNDLSFKWDGYKMSDGIYYWYIKYNDFYDKEFQQKGYVQLVR